MSVAAETRAALREYPFLLTALRAGVVNYTAAARFLDVGEIDAVAAALRRYAEELDAYDQPDRSATVSMRSGVARIGDDTNGLLSVAGETFASHGGDLTAIIAEGDLQAEALAAVLARLRTAEVDPIAAAGSTGTLAVVVERLAAADAVRAVEAALDGQQATD